MGLSVITLALAKQYSDSATASAINTAVTKAVADSKAYTDEALSHIVSFTIKIVDTLPTTDIDPHAIYFVHKGTSSEENNYYYEYMYINNQWELLGSTELDLSGYWTIEETKAYIETQRYSLPKATTSTLGGVIVDGTTISVDENGKISVVKEYVEGVSSEAIDKDFTNINEDEINNLFNTLEEEEEENNG